MKKLLYILLIGCLSFNTKAQSKKIYYNLPDNVSKVVQKRINEIIAKSRGDNYKSQICLEIYSKHDTTQVWIQKLSKDIPALNDVIENSNRFFKYFANDSEKEVPIVFDTDFAWASSLRSKGKEVVNGKQSITTITILRTGWLVEFTYKAMEAKIIVDKMGGY
jgi:hypothetical protein